MTVPRPRLYPPLQRTIHDPWVPVQGRGMRQGRQPVHPFVSYSVYSPREKAKAWKQRRSRSEQTSSRHKSWPACAGSGDGSGRQAQWTGSQLPLEPLPVTPALHMHLQRLFITVKYLETNGLH